MGRDTEGERETQKGEWNRDESGEDYETRDGHPVVNSHLLTNTRAIVLDTNAISSSALIVVITSPTFL